MKPTPKTWALLALTALLLVANLLDLGGGPEAALLPRIAAVTSDQVSRIELSDSVNKVVLVPSDDGPDAAVDAAVDAETDGDSRSWRLLAPVEAPADQQMVRSLLSVFRQETPVDVQVDQGNLDSYGLDAGNGIVVELWAGGDEPTVSLTVGGDAPGGTSFVRMSGDDAIYRARVGGRERFSTKASQWRNRVPLGVSRDQVTSLSLARADGETVVLMREPSAALDDLGHWQLEPAADWPVDDDAIEALVDRLGSLRADEVLADDFAGGFESPLVTATFGLSDGSSRVLVVGSRRHPEAAFLRTPDDGGVYRVPIRAVLDLLRDREGMRDKTLLSFDVADIDTISLDEADRRWTVRQAGGSGRWQVVQPPNVDLDVGRVALAAQSLAALRGDAVADGVSQAEAGLDTPASLVTVYLVDGTGLTVEIGAEAVGPDGQPAHYVRTRGQAEIMVIRQATIQRIKQAFGRT